ncbi:MAG TPA: hypothetical protein VJC04_02255 [Candidatus Paceibacterota bacterium]
MKVFLDCACYSSELYAGQQEQQVFIKSLVSLDEILEKFGITSLSLGHQTANGKDTFAVVKEADCVVVLCDWPSAGVSEMVQKAIVAFDKPLFAFVVRDFNWNVFEFVRGVSVITPYDRFSDIPILIKKLWRWHNSRLWFGKFMAVLKIHQKDMRQSLHKFS